jgi:hypothetical protein
MLAIRAGRDGDLTNGRQGALHAVTNFTSGRILDFSWTRNGKQLPLAEGENTSDVVPISNFR